jgi:hypothetical protein
MEIEKNWHRYEDVSWKVSYKSTNQLVESKAGEWLKEYDRDINLKN